MKRSIRKKNSSRRNNRKSRRITRRNNRRTRRTSIRRKSRRKSRRTRRSMKGGEMSRLKKIGIGATTVGLVGAAVGKALGGDKVALATTLGGAAGAVVGAEIGEYKARRSMKIYATQVNIKTNNSTGTDEYDPEYIGSLNNERLSEIFDRECPYNRVVFNKLFSPLKKDLNNMTQQSLFGNDHSIWYQNDDKSRIFLVGKITHCIYVRSHSNNTLIISVIDCQYLHGQEHVITAEVIPSYYLLPNMKACIQQDNPLAETSVSDDAFSQYSEYSELPETVDDYTCPERQIISDLHQEPELDRWIIPPNVPIEII